MGHADIQTTMKYLHYAPRKEDAELVARGVQDGPGRPRPGDLSERPQTGSEEKVLTVDS
jgi:hypothetical protein